MQRFHLSSSNRRSNNNNKLNKSIAKVSFKTIACHQSLQTMLPYLSQHLHHLSLLPRVSYTPLIFESPSCYFSTIPSFIFYFLSFFRSRSACICCYHFSIFYFFAVNLSFIQCRHSRCSFAKSITTYPINWTTSICPSECLVARQCS
jgi:hypothetical protein